MIINECFPSKWMRESDLKGHPMTVRISRFEVQKVAEENKPVLFFSDSEKGFVVNRTNADTIAGIHGDDTDQWIAKSITLVSADVEYKGKLMKAIRVRPTAGSGTAKGSSVSENDDVPF